MLPETLQLEKLRQQIEEAEFTIGDRSDYLDYGKPNPAEKKQAQELIEQVRNQSAELKAKLHDMISTVRRDNPEALNEWVNFHREILQRILSEKAANTEATVRQSTARGTLNQWEKVIAGEKEYVNINWHYLKDYKAEVRKIFPKNTSPEHRANTSQKSWW